MIQGSIYKVGDQVLIKSKYDDGCNSTDYTCLFSEQMIEKYGGNVVTIKEVKTITYSNKYKLNKEPFYYIIKEDNSRFKWSAEMFEYKMYELIDHDKKSKYNTGDKVLVKSKYDEGCDPPDYHKFFSPYMLKDYGGKELIIRKAIYSPEMDNKSVDDPFIYLCEDNSWEWSSDMFEGKVLCDKKDVKYKKEESKQNLVKNGSVSEILLEREKLQNELSCCKSDSFIDIDFNKKTIQSDYKEFKFNIHKTKKRF